MAIALVGQTTGSVAATTSTTFSYTASAGDLLVIFVARTGGLSTGALSGVTDSASQTWSLATLGAVSGSSDTRIECWYIANTANITSVTLNSTASQTYAWNLTEWSGAATSSALDVASPNPSGHASGTAIVTPSITTTGSTDLVLAAVNNPNSFGDTFNASGSSPTTGWTALTGFNGPSNITVGVGAYQVMSATGSYYAAWTLGSSDPAGIITVAFMAVATSSTTANPGTAGVSVSAYEPGTGSGTYGFSGIQGIGIQGASVQGLQAVGSTTNAPAGIANVNVAGLADSNITIVQPAGLASVTAGANPATPQVTPSDQTGAQVTGTAWQASVPGNVPTGLASATTAGQPPTPQLTVTAGVANVSVVGLPGAVTAGGNTTALPTAAQVTVAGLAPGPQGSVSAGLAGATVAAQASTPSGSAATGVANVTVGGNPSSNISLTATPGLAVVVATAIAPSGVIYAQLAQTVLSTALSPSARVAVTAGVATVTVAGQSVAQVHSPGQANVAVGANQPTVTTAVSAPAGNAAVSVTASQPVAGGFLTAHPGVASVGVASPAVVPHVIPAVQVAQGFAAGMVAQGGPPKAPVAYNGLQLFETPQVRDRPPYLPDSDRRQIMLMRHFETRLRGVSVWKRNDGTYCVDTICNYEAAQTHPAAYFSDDPMGPDLTSTEQGLSDSNVNYPWNPYPGSTNSENPGSYAYNVNWDQTTQDFILNPYLIRWWEGGALNIITQSEAIDLTQGGFGDCITAAPPGAVYTAHSYKGGDNQ